IAGEVARTADAVHYVRAEHVGGVHVAVNVGLDHAVQGNAAQTADDLRVVGDFLGTQQDAFAVVLHVAVEFLDAFGGQREAGGGGELDGAVLDQLQHAILDDFGVGGQALVATAGQA